MKVAEDNSRVAGFRPWEVAMKRSVVLGLVLSVCLLLISSASSPAGMVSENRPVQPFDRVRMSGAGNLYVSQGKEVKLVIETEEDYLDKVRTYVRDGGLVIERDKSWLSDSRPVNAYVSMDRIEGLSASGAVKIIGRTPIVSESLGLKGSGSTGMELEIETDSLETTVSGSGQVRLRGRATTHRFKASGSAGLEAFELLTQKTGIRISGSGRAKVYVVDEINVQISGSGKVQMKGEARIGQLKTSGSGELVRVD